MDCGQLAVFTVLLARALKLLKDTLLGSGITGADYLYARAGKIINVSKVIYVYTVITWQT